MTVAELERKYNPNQLRDPGGEGGGRWVKNPGAEAKEAASHLVADELDIADSIDLQPDEHLVLSDVFSQRGADYELNAAIIQRPAGRQVRLGVTHTDDSWPGDSTDTLHLEPAQFRKLHADLAGAAKEGKTAATQAQKAWNSGSAPSDPRLLGSAPAAKGTVSAGDVNLGWSVHVTDDDPTSWELSLDVEDGGDLTLNPRDTTKLLKFLQTLESHIDTPDASRAYSQESGPAYQAPAGPPQGGQFAKGGGRVGAKGKSKTQRRPAQQKAAAPKPAGPPKPFSYDGKTGTGYGIKGGDPGVRTLQAAVNRLGVLDSSGNELAVDGRYGPRTTSAVEKLQKALGMQVTGQVTPEFLKQVSDLQQLPPKPPRQRRAAKPKMARQSKSRRVAPARRSQILAQVSRALGEHRMVDGVCVTCSDDDEEDDRAVRALLEAFDEIMRLRYVRTEAGAKKYGVPIGSVIGGGGHHGPHAPSVHAPGHTPTAHAPKGGTPDVPVKSAPPKAAAAKPARTTVKDRLVAAINDHLDGKGDGDPLAGFNREQLRKVAKERGVALDRGESRESIAGKLIAHASGGRQSEAPKVEPKLPTPAAKASTSKAKAPAKPSAPAGSASGDAAFSARSAGKDLLGSNPSALANRVVGRRASQHAADHDLAAIGHEQGFDGKPKVVSRAEMDHLVAAGNREVFRGVQGGPGGKNAAEIHAEMRSGHAWYGLGIYGNGYYWGDRSVGTEYSDGTHGSLARAVLSPDAKIADFWKDLYPEHDHFLSGLAGHPDEAQLREVYGDIGRYAAARGYDAIRIDQQHGEPFFNVLNRTALVVEEAP